MKKRKKRKGTKKKANGQFGDDLKDYFRFTSDDPDIVKAFHEICLDALQEQANRCTFQQFSLGDKTKTPRQISDQQVAVQIAGVVFKLVSK